MSRMTGSKDEYVDRLRHERNVGAAVVGMIRRADWATPDDPAAFRDEVRVILDACDAVLSERLLKLTQ